MTAHKSINVTPEMVSAGLSKISQHWIDLQSEELGSDLWVELMSEVFQAMTEAAPLSVHGVERIDEQR